jgi:citronellyl-CoA dehydrogenase
VDFTEEHELFRRTVREVIARHILPFVDKWEDAGCFPGHELFPVLAEAGLLGLEYDEEFGGQGADHSYTLVLGEELGAIPSMGLMTAIAVQTDMATPSLHRFGTPELKRRFLTPALRGEAVAAIAVTEPDAGSDVAGLRTRAADDGTHWVLNGAKTYITNGTQADWFCLLARTSEMSANSPYSGMSQILVPSELAGVTVSRSLRKVGNKASDTAELAFTDVRVPKEFTIGVAGRGFQQQMEQFQQERMIGAYMAVGGMLEALRRTREYVLNRRAFGKPLADQQYISFRLTELAAQLDLVRNYTHTCAQDYVRGTATVRQTCVSKLAAGRLQREIADMCLQFHGGLGYMEENWTGRYFRDARLLSIGGGADEIMLRTIARLDGLPG